MGQHIVNRTDVETKVTTATNLVLLVKIVFICTIYTNKKNKKTHWMALPVCQTYCTHT